MIAQCAPSVEELVAQVAPTLRQYAPAAEAQRQLTPEAVVALRDAGLFGTWVPQAYGGLEMDPVWLNNRATSRRFAIIVGQQSSQALPTRYFPAA